MLQYRYQSLINMRRKVRLVPDSFRIRVRHQEQEHASIDNFV